MQTEPNNRKSCWIYRNTQIAHLKLQQKVVAKSNWMEVVEKKNPKIPNVKIDSVFETKKQSLERIGRSIDSL